MRIKSRGLPINIAAKQPLLDQFVNIILHLFAVEMLLHHNRIQGHFALRLNHSEQPLFLAHDDESLFFGTSAQKEECANPSEKQKRNDAKRPYAKECSRRS